MAKGNGDDESGAGLFSILGSLIPVIATTFTGLLASKAPAGAAKPGAAKPPVAGGHPMPPHPHRRELQEVAQRRCVTLFRRLRVKS